MPARSTQHGCFGGALPTRRGARRGGWGARRGEPAPGDPAPGPMITSNLGFLVVAGLTSVLYVGIVSALLTPA